MFQTSLSPSEKFFVAIDTPRITPKKDIPTHNLKKKMHTV